MDGVQRNVLLANVIDLISEYIVKCLPDSEIQNADDILCVFFLFQVHA